MSQSGVAYNLRSALPVLIVLAAGLLLFQADLSAGEPLYSITAGSTWNYLQGTGEASLPDITTWRTVGFDDAAWHSGAAAIGYGEPGEVATDVSTLTPPMQDNYRCLFFRRSFQVGEPESVAVLRTSVDFDDGLVVWINGEEVLRLNMPGSMGDQVLYDEVASGEHESGTFEEYELPDPAGYLVPGTNVVAAQLFNNHISSDDAAFDLSLYEPFGPDTTPPVVALRVPVPDTTVRTLRRVEISFSETVTGVEGPDLIVNAVRSTDVSGSGSGPYVFTVEGPATGSAEILWHPDHGITDLADPPNPFAGGSWTCTVDPDAPIGNVTITEFLASNVNGIEDEDGDRQDWIELCNESDEPALLSGFSLTDDPEDPRKWILPDIELVARGCLFVYASGKDRRPANGDALHTNFKLKASGEYLGLFPWDADKPVIEFAPYFREQRADHSYGRSAAGQWGYYDNPTPGSPNPDGTPFGGFVAEPAATPQRGIYGTGQATAATLSCQTAGASIRYTLDWSEPSPLHGTLYEEPIQLTPSDRQPSIVVRAVAYKNQLLPSKVVTFTYVFPDHVIHQTEDPIGFPVTWPGAPAADYEMDVEVVDGNEDWLKDALTAIPSMSIVAPIENLFGASGIYVNPRSEGIVWERPGSVELLYPEPEKPGFQADAGLSIDGSASRNPNSSPKHSFRLCFGGDDGPVRLIYPLFEDSPVTSFDCLVLRAGYSNSWIHWDSRQRTRCQYIRDQWIRDTLLDMGRVSPHGTFVHLYVNGLYWGLFNLVEQPNAAFAASYLGGERTEYDALSSGTAIDGNTDAWNEMMSIASQDLSSGTRYQAIQKYLFVPNLIDYMIVNIYGHNSDWPGGGWYAAGRPESGAGYRFYSWDAERILEDDVNADKSGISSPYAATLYAELQDNEEFVVLFGDHLHRHFFNGGAMMPEAIAERWEVRAGEIEKAVWAESARWGDYRRDVHSYANGPFEFYRYDTHWAPERQRLLTEYFPARSAVVLENFRDEGLYPGVGAPIFSQHGGTIDPGFSLSMSMPAGTTGTIWYTTSGADPRVTGGVLAVSARRYTDPIVLNDPVRVRARTRAAGQWSALTDATFHIPRPLDKLRFTEIMYNPAVYGILAGDEYEFIELKNTGDQVLDLSGVSMTNGVFYEFPEGVILLPGQFVVMAANIETFRQRYPGVAVIGEYRQNLANAGDTVELRSATGDLIVAVTYRDGEAAPWLREADGEGHSLVPVDPAGTGDPSDPATWRVSTEPGGSPGADDLAPELAAPAIVTHPQDLTIMEGEAAAFSAAAQGWPVPGYQWHQNEIPLPGATRMTYVIPAATLEDDGAVVRCVAANGLGSDTSEAATLTVLPIPRTFVRGNANGDGTVDVSDGIYVLLVLFSHIQSRCDDANDANDDGAVDIADAVTIFTWLFAGGSPLPLPFPGCGEDPTDDGLGCEVVEQCR